MIVPKRIKDRDISRRTALLQRDREHANAEQVRGAAVALERWTAGVLALLAEATAGWRPIPFLRRATAEWRPVPFLPGLPPLDRWSWRWPIVRTARVESWREPIRQMLDQARKDRAQ